MNDGTPDKPRRTGSTSVDRDLSVHHGEADATGAASPQAAAEVAGGTETTAERDASKKARRRMLLGAMFLMSTSAIGPGFITQTTAFTVTLGAAFAFAILVSILVDIAVQLNVWRVIGVSGRRAQELGNLVFPGVGYALAALVVMGGLVFNIGNVGGGGLGLDALLGIEPRVGGAITAAVAVAVFLSHWAGVAMDRIVVVMGLIMISLTGYVAVVSDPPLGDALRNTVMPDEVQFLTITTLIGGTVGGYITYAGAHRLLDSGVTGPKNVGEISRSSVTGIIVTGIMRVFLFLAILGVVAGGVKLAAGNPAASAFQSACGDVGLRLFGMVLWAASITSVIGASYTSVSFVTTFHRKLAARRNLLTVGFILVSAIAYLVLGKTPVKLLIFAGGFNGLILPLGFTVVLWVAARRRDLLGGYVYPKWLLASGILAWGLTLYLGWKSLEGLQKLWA
jgi:Mn2+/Fe2+ NRAMP family transporter